jgi:hypothetical protein
VTSRQEKWKIVNLFLQCTLSCVRGRWLGNLNKENILYTVVILLYFYGPGDTEKTVLAGCTPPWAGFGGRTVEACPPNPRVSSPLPPSVGQWFLSSSEAVILRRFPEIDGSSILYARIRIRIRTVG